MAADFLQGVRKVGFVYIIYRATVMVERNKPSSTPWECSLISRMYTNYKRPKIDICVYWFGRFIFKIYYCFIVFTREVEIKENFRIRNEREARITIWSSQPHAPEKVFLPKKFLNALAFWSLQIFLTMFLSISKHMV